MPLKNDGRLDDIILLQTPPSPLSFSVIRTGTPTPLVSDDVICERPLMDHAVSQELSASVLIVEIIKIIVEIMSHPTGVLQFIW